MHSSGLLRNFQDIIYQITIIICVFHAPWTDSMSFLLIMLYTEYGSLHQNYSPVTKNKSNILSILLETDAAAAALAQEYYIFFYSL